MTRTTQRLAFAPVDERADEVMVPMRDGVRLATDVYLPTGPGPFPTVLVRLPYDKASPFAFMPVVARYLNAHGYALVAQDVRGKVRSEGETFAFVHEAADGYDTIDWVVRRPWCAGGAVAMFGDSYYGYTQWAAAASGHPGLRAMVPRMTSSRVAADWMYHGGVFNLGTMGEWAAHTWVDHALWESPWDFGVRPLSRLVEAWTDGRSSASFDRWRAAPPDDPWWSTLLPGGPPAGRLGVPALHMGGWWDVFQRGQVADWAAARRAGRAPQHLVLDATDHFDDELRPDDAPVADPLADEASVEAFMPRYLDTAIRFLDEHLAGRGPAGLAPVRFRVAGAGWRSADAWPPPGSEPLVLHLADAPAAGLGPEGGTLTARPGRSRAKAGWTHRPEDLVPSLVADPWRPLLGLPDERDVETRDDVLTFTSDEWPVPLDLAGPIRARLRMATSGPSTHAVCKLVDVFPSGRARRIAEGPAVVAPGGEPTEVRVDLGHAGYRLAPGHRLRLELAASGFPRYLPHPGTADDPWGPGRLQDTDQTVHLGGDAGSRLELTILPTTPGVSQ